MGNESLLVDWRQRWNRSLIRFLRRRVRSAFDVQDVAQETYLRLLRATDLSEVRNPLAYLLQVANHVAVEWLERQPPSDAMILIDQVSLVDERLPEFELDAKLTQKRIDRALTEVSPTMRAVLLLKLRDGRSTEEIAADLQITVRQVRRYVARGYERLREAIEG